MTTLEQPRTRQDAAIARAARQPRRRFFADPGRRLSLGVFGVSFACYFALGWWTTLVKHVTIFDAVARLGHGYFVWWNAPPKLAAIGFYWPPVSTLVFLPFTAIRPLATSLLALPLVTALFAAALLVTLDRAARLVGMPWFLRYPLLLAFAANPMVAFYATNGMSEMPALFLLALGFYEFLCWFLTREARFLIVAGIALALASLTRYEIMAYAFLIVPIMTAAMIRQRVSRDTLEGSLIAYLVPIAYCTGLWIFMNWLLLGDPIAFLHGGVPTTQANVNPNTTPGPQTPAAATSVAQLPVDYVARHLLSMNWQLFAPTIVVCVVLVLVFLVRRDLMALSLCAAIGMNAATTFLLILHSGQMAFLQLRYNMRALPLVMLGICWLYLSMRRPATRLAFGLCAVALVTAAIPITWKAMDTFPFQYGEQAFYEALHGKDMEGQPVQLGYVMGVAPDAEMGRYIARHVHGRNAVLTDDAQSLTVMLLSGHPDRFFDRIDEGDARWIDVARSPFGRTRYVLVTTTSMPTQVHGFSIDWMRYVWPYLIEPPKRTPGFTLVHRNARYALYSVARESPLRTAARLASRRRSSQGP